MEKTLDSIINNSRLNVAVESKLKDAAKRMFSDIFSVNTLDKLKSRVLTLATSAKKHNGLLVRKVDDRIRNWADRESYITIGDVTVYVPVGLNVTYVTYVSVLEELMTFLQHIDSDLIKPIQKELGAVTNNPDILASKSGFKFNTSKASILKLDIEEMTKKLSDCFDANSKDSTMPYKKAFARNSELEEVHKRTSNLLDQMKVSEPDKVHESVNSLFGTVESLVEVLKDNYGEDEMKKMDGTMVLSEVMYQAAKWVEFYGVVNNQLLMLSSAINDTEEKLLKIAKK